MNIFLVAQREVAVAEKFHQLRNSSWWLQQGANPAGGDDTKAVLSQAESSLVAR